MHARTLGSTPGSSPGVDELLVADAIPPERFRAACTAEDSPEALSVAESCELSRRELWPIRIAEVRL
jgi:hypothetical protein